MSIDINGITPAKVHGSVEDPKLERPTEQTPVQQESGKSSTADTLSISDSAQQLGKLKEAVASLPVVDTQRVEQMKQAIKNGSYEVDPAKVADKLMQFESILKPEGS